MEPSRPDGRAAGVALYAAGMFLFSVNDGLGKWLVTDYGAGELMAIRTLGAALVLGVLLWRTPVDLRLRGRYGLHVLRVLCLSADTFAFYASSKTMPLADLMTFYAASPIVIVALSAAFLGERLGPARLSAVALGFLGVVVALRPTAAAFTPTALLALAGTVMYGVSVTITRGLRDTHWLPLVGCQFLGSGLIGGLASVATWVTPGPRDFGLLVLIGAVSVACFLAVTKALTVAAASTLAPLQYTSIAWGALIGWLAWGDVPSAATLTGVALIVASGLIVLYPERVRAREPA